MQQTSYIHIVVVNRNLGALAHRLERTDQDDRIDTIVSRSVRKQALDSNWITQISLDQLDAAVLLLLLGRVGRQLTQS